MVQIACSKCAVGVMDQNNPHLHNKCSCPCHHLLPFIKLDTQRNWGCKEENCSVSTGIGNELTFGKGELDYYGYWSIPCYLCARDWEKNHPEDGACWPFEPVEKEIPGAYLRL